MKIVLIKPADSLAESSVYTSQKENKGVFTRQHYGEHLGLGYIAASLQKAGHEVYLLYQLQSISDFTKQILDLNPDIVMATALTGAFNTAKAIFRNLKDINPRIITIIGGDHISSHPQSVDDVAIDYGIIGEGELTSINLVDAIQKNTNSRLIPGIAFVDCNSGLIINLPANKIKNLDELPFPFRTSESISQTRFSAIFDPASSKALPMGIFYTSRGCPFNCKECSSKNIFGQGVRYRSIENVISEIKLIKKKFGIKAMTFYDLTFNANKKHVEELCNALIKEKINLHWYAMTRATLPNGTAMLDKSLLELMFDSGCRKISFGIESFDAKISSSFEKKSNSRQLTEILGAADSSGIINRAFLMLGYNDSPESLQANLVGLEKYPIHEVRISILTPFPGTLFYNECLKNKLFLTFDWTKFTGDYSILNPLYFNSASDLLIERKKLFQKFIKSDFYSNRMKEKIKRNPWFKEGVKEYFQFLKTKNIL